MTTNALRAAAVKTTRERSLTQFGSHGPEAELFSDEGLGDPNASQLLKPKK